MMKNILLSQVYWPGEDVQVRDGKWKRLAQVMVSGVFGSERAWEITIRRHVKKRTAPANNYLWGVVYTVLSDETGYEREELHEIMCGKFFGTRIVELFGVSKRVPIRSTTTNEQGEADTLGVGDFAQFVDFVIREAAIHMDVVIPPPTTEQVPRE